MLEKAVHWIKSNTAPGRGIVISSRNETCYPEVTGYLIPTLLSVGERHLAQQYARWLVSVQHNDGSFGLRDITYAFDTGQVVRGWVSLLAQMPELERPLRRACDWLVNTADSLSGRLIVPPRSADWSLGARGQVNEGIHIYVLQPLKQAAELLNEPRYGRFADKSLDYYLKNVNLTDFTQPNALTHFYAYIQEALLELGCDDKARQGMASVAQFQQSTGAVPGYSNVNWVCSPGLAQLTVVWYLLGETERADSAVAFLEMLQNSSGGFYGSYGPGANYKPAEEISWAAKYAVEAAQKRIAAHFDKTSGIYSARIAETDGRTQAVLRRLGDLNGKRVLDAGCGKGRYAAIIKRHHPQAYVTGMDISAEMLKCVPPGIRTVQHGILNMPFDNDRFDAVICIEALEHVVQIAEGVKELARVLAPDGKLIVIDKNKENLGALKMPSWEKWFAQEELLGLMHANGLSAAAELISHGNATDPDGLFVCWTGQKPASRTASASPVTEPDGKPRRLAVVPSDPLDAYAHKSDEYLTDYFNPTGFFHEVYCLSSLEKSAGFRHGMHVIPTGPEQFAQRIKELEIDIVRAYGGYRACDLACQNKVEGVPVVVSVHDKRESWLHDSIRNADYVLSVSNAVRELLLAKGIPSNKIYDLANRVDLQVFHPCSDEKLRAEFCDRYPGKYRILHVGRRAPEKNLDTLIRALATLGPDYVCISVGKGDDTEYRRLAEQCGVSRRCYFVGSVPHAQLPHYYSFCDCMCTPSRSEGFGLVFIEALACEAVVVTSNIAPMNEYITNGVSGILVEDFENPAALAEALVQACTDNELRSTIQSNARIAAEPFNKERIDELEGSLYKRFLELGARAGADSQDSSLWSLREKSDAEQLQSKEESGSPLPQKRVCVVNRKPTLPGAPRTKECHQKSGRYLRMQQMLKSCGKIIDLGCGNNPVAGAVVAVDYYVDPRQRSIGYGPPIDENIFRQRNIQFINQKIDVELPFYDKEFDFAYSHHVFEHLDDPATACSEMIRIAKAGAIITPSVFAEMCFGRPYHKWFVIDRDNAIFFFEKRKGEDRPFGDHPQWTQDKGWVSTEKTNPFDMVLNESGWYHEEPCNALERLRERLRQLWFSHSPVIEVVFLWQDSFTYTVIKEATGDNESFDVRDAANIEQVPEEQRIKINAL